MAMQHIIFEATERCPRVDFNFAAGRLLLKGESYPEDAAAFFGPLLRDLREHLEQQAGGAVTFDLEMDYFNSSSAKALMNLFQLLEAAASRGTRVDIHWRYHPDDDTMQEFGEDFASDFTHAHFHLCPIPG